MARMLRGAPVNGAVPAPLCDMRCHDPPPERGDKVGAVVSLVCSGRQAPGRAGGVPIDHLERRPALGAPIGMDQTGCPIRPLRFSISVCPLKHSVAAAPGAVL